THNRDDHVKNFSFILDDRTGKWSLAPAYDLTLTDGPGGEHSMTVAGEGRAPAYRHIAELAGQYGVAEKELGVMIDEVAAAVERWPEFAGVAGVRGAVSARVSRRLAAVRFGGKG
ncbi:MAG: HipA domain-containing protein, partial [Candidatus Electrothrix sp. MAN1_4]|nr:HipA domain-containing protein [Candidatus Electrothrix sp. MAN1_4]